MNEDDWCWYHEFSADLEQDTKVKKFYIFRGENYDDRNRRGDLYLLRSEVGPNPPRSVKITVEWK